MKNHLNKTTLVFLIFLFFLCLNYFQPISGDDVLRYSMDVLYKNSMLHQLSLDYRYLSGRFSAQILIYIFLNKSYPSLLYAFDLINSLIMTSFIIILYKVTTNNKGVILSREFAIFLSIFIILFGLNGTISQVLCKTLGIQYFWGIALLTLFYYQCFTREIFNPVLSFITGLFIGLYNEAIFLICFGIIFSYILHQVIQHRTINKNIYFFLVPFILGGIVMFTAPGSYAITEARYHESPFQLLVKNFGTFILMIFTEYELSPLFILAIITVIKFETHKTRKIITLFCLILVWLTIYPICFQFERRLSMIYMLFYFSIIIYYIYNYSDKLINLITKHYKLFIFGALIMAFLFLYIFSKYYYYETLRFNKIKYYKNIGKEKIILKPIKFPGIHLMKVDDINQDPKYYVNTSFANIYGIKEVALASD